MYCWINRRLMLAWLLGFILLAPGCSGQKRGGGPVQTKAWADHPELPLALSQAILDGMRQLQQELLISERAFDSTAVSIASGAKPLLEARVADFVLQPERPAVLFAQWDIYLISNDLMDYTNTVKFQTGSPNASADHPDFTPRDTLYLDVYAPHSEIFGADARVPESIEMIYWRNKKGRDRMAILTMRRNQGKRYVLVH